MVIQLSPLSEKMKILEMKIKYDPLKSQMQPTGHGTSRPSRAWSFADLSDRNCGLLNQLLLRPLRFAQ